MQADPEETTLSNLSERLVYALNQLNITQAELARKINIKPQAIHYLCTSKSQKSRFTYEIADALQISSLWLGAGEGEMRLNNHLNDTLFNTLKRIPILDWKQVKLLAHENHPESLLNTAKEWLLTNSDTGVNGFAFRLQDNSLYPRFDQDTIMIINSSKSPQNKDFVIAYLKESNEIVFRQYELKDTTVFLNPMNSVIYKAITLQEDDSILGVMMEARWQV